MPNRTTRLAGLVLVLALAACGSGTTASTAADGTASTAADGTTSTAAGGIRLVSADEGATLLEGASDDLVILDVRTPEEFSEARIDGAVMIDFYDDDFEAQLATLDPDATYLLYCRSGNRSGQTTEIMRTLGFTDVADVDGGILAWTSAGLPVVAG